jgi:aspartate/glutamate racemase
MHLVYPNEEMQKFVTLGICNAKNTKRYDISSEECPKNLFTKVCDYLLAQGVDCIVGGCTDINAVFCPNEWKSVRYVDSLSVLAYTIMKRVN